MEDYYKQSELISRAWSRELIKRFLGEPDATEPNPVRKDGDLMKLFSIDRVEAIEQSNEFKSALRKELEEEAKILKKREKNHQIQRWTKPRPRTLVQKIKTWRKVKT
jgi:hypothetical protein